MKFSGGAIAWGFNRFVKSFGNIFSLAASLFTPVKKGVVMCWAHNFKQYGCNPRALTEYILENNSGYEVYWVFRHKIDIAGIDKRIKCVRFRSLAYYKLVNKAEFLITNSRTDPYHIYWHKRQGQKYIMTWHGGVALKKVEKDVEDKLGYSYVVKAKRDSKVCDLMLSGAKTQTQLLKDKFWYKGEILEKGTPRCDIFFKSDRHKEIKSHITRMYNIPETAKIILYAPTFRRSKSIEPYRIDWNQTVEALKKFYSCDQVRILLRLHPNLLKKVDTTPLINSSSVIDATRYHDMQELMCISDMLITDYSSSMFDFTLLERPCLLYATDLEQYDRGYYFSFTKLPFPLARTQKELISCIESFDIEKYQNDVQEFNRNEIGMFESGVAGKSLVEWMKRHSI